MNKQLLFPAFGIALALSVTAMAQQTLSGEVTSDLYYPSGVLLQDVQNGAVGVASVEIEGVGSVTAGNQAGGGYPQLQVLGGTTITSTRKWDEEELNKTSWDGQFTSPGTTLTPDEEDISFTASAAASLEVIEAYVWGLSNETFTYDPEAIIVFEVTSAQENQKIWVAHASEDETTWTVEADDYCVVQNNFCALSVGSVNKLALIKEQFTTCPVNIANGSIGQTPNCIITCNQNYTLTEDGNNCELLEGAEAGDGDLFAEDGFEEAFYQPEALAGVPKNEYDFPAGHFRYRDTVATYQRYLPEDLLVEEEDVAKAQKINTGFLSRNPRSTEEQLAAASHKDMGAGELTDEENDSLMSYLWQMRSRFSGDENKSHNVEVLAASEEETSDADDTDGEEADDSVLASDDGEAGEFLGAAPLLPSTGPSFFAVLALLGFVLMLFGVRRT